MSQPLTPMTEIPLNQAVEGIGPVGKNSLFSDDWLKRWMDVAMRYDDLNANSTAKNPGAIMHEHQLLSEHELLVSALREAGYFWVNEKRFSQLKMGSFYVGGWMHPDGHAIKIHLSKKNNQENQNEDVEIAEIESEYVVKQLPFFSKSLVVKTGQRQNRINRNRLQKYPETLNSSKTDEQTWCKRRGAEKSAISSFLHEAKKFEEEIIRPAVIELNPWHKSHSLPPKSVLFGRDDGKSLDPVTAPFESYVLNERKLFLDCCLECFAETDADRFLSLKSWLSEMMSDELVEAIKNRHKPHDENTPRWAEYLRKDRMSVLEELIGAQFGPEIADRWSEKGNAILNNWEAAIIELGVTPDDQLTPEKINEWFDRHPSLFQTIGGISWVHVWSDPTYTGKNFAFSGWKKAFSELQYTEAKIDIEAVALSAKRVLTVFQSRIGKEAFRKLWEDQNALGVNGFQFEVINKAPRSRQYAKYANPSASQKYLSPTGKALLSAVTSTCPEVVFDLESGGHDLHGAFWHALLTRMHAGGFESMHEIESEFASYQSGLQSIGARFQPSSSAFEKAPVSPLTPWRSYFRFAFHKLEKTTDGSDIHKIIQRFTRNSEDEDEDVAKEFYSLRYILGSGNISAARPSVAAIIEGLKKRGIEMLNERMFAAIPDEVRASWQHKPAVARKPGMRRT